MGDAAEKPITLNDSMRKLCSNEGSLLEIKTSVEELRSDIHCLKLKVENESLRKEVGEEKRKREKLEEDVAEAKHSARVALQRSNDLDQYIRRNNIRIYGLPEKKTSGDEREEDVEDVEQAVLGIFNGKLGLNIKPVDLEAAHRIGRVGQREVVS